MMALEANFITPFAMGAIEVIKVQAGSRISVGESCRVKAGDFYYGDISGEIHVNSEAFVGVMAVCFPEKTYLNVMSKLLGIPLPALTPDIEDGAAEFANMIFGHAKRTLTDRGRKMEMALPKVLIGKKVPAIPSSDRFRIFLNTELGDFAIEILESAT